MTAYETGVVTEASDQPLGDELLTDHAAGATILTVGDAGDFNENGGTLVLGLDDAGAAQEVVTYTSADLDFDTIALSTPLAAAWSAETPVRPYPVTRGRRALVELDDEGGAVEARVPFSMVDRLPVGTRLASTAERVVLTMEGEEYVVGDVLGRQPVIDGTFVNGKNRIIYSTSDPSEDGAEVAGDSWFKLADTDFDGQADDVVGLWKHDGNDYVQQTLDDAVIGRLSVGKLVAGFIQASSYIAAGTPGGRRVEMQGTAGAFRAYNASNVQTVNIDGANNYVEGKFATGISGQRVEISDSGTGGQVQMFTGNAGEVGALLRSSVYDGDHTAEITSGRSAGAISAGKPAANLRVKCDETFGPYVTTNAPFVMTQPYSFRVRSATQSIPNTTWTVVTWPTNDNTREVVYNSGISGAFGAMDLALGVYMVTVYVTFDTNATGRRGLRVRGGNAVGSTTVYTETVLPPNSGTTTGVAISALVPLFSASADELFVEAFQSSGAALNITEGRVGVVYLG